MPSPPSFKMATRPILIKFEAATKQWQRTCIGPSSVFPPYTSQADINRLADFLDPIFADYFAECVLNFGAICEQCPQSSTDYLLHAYSLLDRASDPYVKVFVGATCGRSECKRAAWKARVDHTRQYRIPTHNTDLDGCAICGKHEETVQCEICKVIGYCGIEHKEMDRLVHKKYCKVPEAAESSK